MKPRRTNLQKSPTGMSVPSCPATEKGLCVAGNPPNKNWSLRKEHPLNNPGSSNESMMSPPPPRDSGQVLHEVLEGNARLACKRCQRTPASTLGAKHNITIYQNNQKFPLSGSEGGEGEGWEGGKRTLRVRILFSRDRDHLRKMPRSANSNTPHTLNLEDLVHMPQFFSNN